MKSWYYFEAVSIDPTPAAIISQPFGECGTRMKITMETRLRCLPARIIDAYTNIPVGYVSLSYENGENKLRGTAFLGNVAGDPDSTRLEGDWTHTFDVKAAADAVWKQQWDHFSRLEKCKRYIWRWEKTVWFVLGTSVGAILQFALRGMTISIGV